jgi:hypothetical protein
MQRELSRWRQSVNAQTNHANPNFNQARYEELYVNFVASKFDPLHATRDEWERISIWRRSMDAVLGENRSNYCGAAATDRTRRDGEGSLATPVLSGPWVCPLESGSLAPFRRMKDKRK